MVDVALQVTAAPVEALSPVAGDQLYVLAPDALIEVEEPLQIAADTGVIVTVGSGLTVSVNIIVSVQPAALVPVTV